MSDTVQPVSAFTGSDPTTSEYQPPSPATQVYPPLPDSLARPLTTQGSRTPLRPFSATYSTTPRIRSTERPYTAHGTSNALPVFSLGPYMSASAHTSYTRVDLDLPPAEMYPSLPEQSSSPLNSPQLSPGTSSNAVNAGLPTIPNEPIELPVPQMAQVTLTFLLVSGRRKTQTFDPETTVGRVKELVWNAWPTRDAAWPEERPPAPSYFRILYLGKILQDEETLMSLGFPASLPPSSPTTPTIVHLSIRPYAISSEDPALSKKARLASAFARRGNSGHTDDLGADDADRAGCCGGCLIC